jgi:hypothetical protein
MITIFQVLVTSAHDADSLLSAEVLRETQAQVMTLEQAAARGFSGARPDPKGREIRLVAVPPRDAQFVQRRLEANPAVLSFEKHDVDT